VKKIFFHKFFRAFICLTCIVVYRFLLFSFNCICSDLQMHLGWGSWWLLPVLFFFGWERVIIITVNLGILDDKGSANECWWRQQRIERTESTLIWDGKKIAGGESGLCEEVKCNGVAEEVKVEQGGDCGVLLCPAAYTTVSRGNNLLGEVFAY